MPRGYGRTVSSAQDLTIRSRHVTTGTTRPLRPGSAWRRHALVMSIVAFGLHFAWETIQCPLFFDHRGGTQAAMIQAALGDVILTWLAYLAVAGAMRTWRWHLERWSARAWLVLMTVAVGLGTGIEAYALATSRWSYTTLAPLLPGTRTSLVPVLQLVVLSPLTFWLARWIAGWRAATALARSA